jgi:ribosomal-protein-alanine N-acetyltransferase
MSLAVTVRPAAAALSGALADLHATSFEDHWPEDAILALLSREYVHGFVAMVNDAEPVGFVLIQVIAEEAEILTICIVPAHRSKKAGRLLLETAIGQARERGAAKMFLEVAETNLAARRIYGLAGFGPVGRRKAYYPGGGGATGAADALVLRKDLVG